MVVLVMLSLSIIAEAVVIICLAQANRLLRERQDEIERWLKR